MVIAPIAQHYNIICSIGLETVNIDVNANIISLPDLETFVSTFEYIEKEGDHGNIVLPAVQL